MSDQQHPTDPVLSRVQRVPGGLYGDEPYEAAPSSSCTRTAAPPLSVPTPCAARCAAT
ncbi:hypothetical protein [Streptomyces asoensis]|uniref:hypothetical protein n=1 Tax=Streptomyces asoensis TaxID=249586 RepID=UPI003402C49D